MHFVINYHKIHPFTTQINLQVNFWPLLKMGNAFQPQPF